MNNRIIYLFAISLSLLGAGCRDTAVKTLTDVTEEGWLRDYEVTEGKPAIIAGIVLNRQVYPTIREVTLEVPFFDGYGQKYVSPLDSMGRFRFDFLPVTVREVSLKPVTDAIVIGPGDSVFVTADFKKSGGVWFTGDREETNRNIQRFMFTTYLGRYKSAQYNTTPEEHKQNCDDYLAESIKRYREFCGRNQTTEEFRKWAEATMLADYASAILQINNNMVLFRGNQNYPEGYFSFLSDLDKRLTKSIINARYYEFASEYFNHYLGINLNNDKTFRSLRGVEADSMFIDRVTRLTSNDLISQMVLSRYLVHRLSSNNHEHVDRQPAMISSLITEPFLLKDLQERYNFVVEYRRNPSVLSDAMLGIADHGSVWYREGQKDGVRYDLVKSIIEENPDNVIHISFWAEWCPPCIPDLMNARPVINKYREEPVRFVFICMSDSTTGSAWVRRLNVGGIHYYLHGDEFLHFQTRFGFTSIPHYVLINREGVIVNFGSFLRPGFQSTQELINKLINQ